MAILPLVQAIPRFKANENRIDILTNGTALQTWTTSEGVVLPSFAKFLADKDAEINLEADGILAQTEAAKDEAIAAVNNLNNAIFGTALDLQLASVRPITKRAQIQFRTSDQIIGSGFMVRRTSLLDLTGYPTESYFRSLDRYLPDGSTNELYGGYWVIDNVVLQPAMFGILGDGSNEQTLIQSLLNFASGRIIKWDTGKTYGYNFLTIPDDVIFSGVDFTFRRLNSNVSAGIRINSGFNAQYLKITSPGGVGGDKALRVQGSINTIEFLHIEADAEGNGSNSNWAIETESNPTGSYISRLTINGAYCRNYSTFMTGALVTFFEIKNVVIENYRTAVYFRDIVRSRFINFRVRGLGAAVNGAPGENGLLLESTTDRATSDCVFEDWIVEDSGEHAYRLGGQRTIQNIWFNQCKAKRSGSSILSGNLSSGEWHGGCGFKVLGGGSVGGTRHKNIFLNQCGVIDVNPTIGTYPAGHGVNNYTPFLIVLAENVHLNGCFIVKEGQTYAARNGALIGHCKGVYLRDCDFRDLESSAVCPYQESAVAGFPGYDSGQEDIHIHGGRYEVTNVSAGAGIVYYIRENITYPWKNITIKDAEFRGGASAIRVETVGAGGSFSNCSAEFTYLDPSSVVDSTATSPIALGIGIATWLMNMKSVTRPAAFSISCADGSTHNRLDTAKAFDRISATWVERVKYVTTDAGAYTPVAAGLVNADAVTPSFTNWFRVGNVVHLFGRIDIDPTATGAVSFRINVPVAFDLTASRQAGGTISTGNGSIIGVINAETTNDALQFSVNTTATALIACSFSCSYVCA